MVDDALALDMDVESDEAVVDEVMSDEESEGEDVGVTEALHTRGDMMEEEENSLRVEDIDSFWLQRQINEYMKDAVESQQLAEKVLAVLQSVDEVGMKSDVELIYIDDC